MRSPSSVQQPRPHAKITSRRGQLQAMEPIIIVIVLAIIIGIVMLFYTRISAQENRAGTTRYQAREDIAMLGRLTTMPELACPRSETVKTYCIDIGKATAFAAMMNDPKERIYYNPFLGATNLTLKWYDMQQDKMNSLALYNNLRDPERITTTTTYFTVFEPVNSTRQFAMLIVERQS